MKLKLFLLAVLPLSIFGCQTNSIQPPLEPEVPISQPQKIENPKYILSSYKWYYAPDDSLAPLELKLDGSGKFFMKGTCNSFFNSYELDGDKMILRSVLAGTLGACIDPDGKVNLTQENFASHVFSKGFVYYSLDLTNSDQPILTIKTQNGEEYIFKSHL